MATRNTKGGRPAAARVTPVHAADMPRGPFTLVLVSSNTDKHPLEIPIGAHFSKRLRDLMERHEATLSEVLKASITAAMKRDAARAS